MGLLFFVPFPDFNHQQRVFRLELGPFSLTPHTLEDIISTPEALNTICMHGVRVQISTSDLSSEPQISTCKRLLGISTCCLTGTAQI